uniref:C-type lectin domain-containing protein n=1 Tax=Panagrolaimus davidi TaxID=227884 RepID=A0A914PM20_9BILA
MLKLILIFAALFLITKASCPNGSLEWQTNCFFFNNNTIGFASAEIECVQNGGHLVSIHDVFTNTLLAQQGGIYFHESTITDFWIGLNNMMPSGNWTWMDGTPLDFTDWAPGEPKNVTGNNCATLSINDGYWRSENCFKTKPYICKVDKSFYEPSTTPITTTTSGYPAFVQCPYPFAYFQPTHSCYGVGSLTVPSNWSVAEQYCLGYGGHLASIHSVQEINFLASYLYVSSTQYWTGAFSNDGGKTWKWSDETPWDYNPWAGQYPNMKSNACGFLWGSAIGDTPCSTLFRMICKKQL